MDATTGSCASRKPWARTASSQNGFEEATLYTYEDRPALAKANTEMLLIMLEEFATNHVARIKGPEAGEKLRQLVQRIYVESLGGVAMHVPKLVYVARKSRD